MITGKELQQSPCTRRTMLKVGAGVACTLACGTMTGCGEATLDGPVDLTLSDYPELEEIGGLATVSEADSGFKYPIFIYRRGEDDYISYSSECTHTGCEIELHGGSFECPCHGSTFDIEGKNTGGPAKQDLVAFTVDIAAEDDRITLSP